MKLICQLRFLAAGFYEPLDLVKVIRLGCLESSGIMNYQERVVPGHDAMPNRMVSLPLPGVANAHLFPLSS